MSVCLDDLNSLPERYRKQIQQQMQAQQINRTARVMAQFVAKGKADTVKRKHHNHPTARTMPNGTEYTFDSTRRRRGMTSWYCSARPGLSETCGSNPNSR